MCKRRMEAKKTRSYTLMNRMLLMVLEGAVVALLVGL